MKIRNTIYFLIARILIFQFPNQAFSQNISRHCDFPLLLEKELKLNPDLVNQIRKTENEFYRFEKEQRKNSMNNLPIVIPLVVHVLYNSPLENLQDSQVMKMVTVLNEDLGRYNLDTANTPAAFSSIAASTGIQFCMVTHDSIGNVFNGIDHYYTSTVQFTSPYQMGNPTFGGIAAWNTDQYFNIWIGNATGWVNNSAFSAPIYPQYHSSWGLFADYSYVNQIQLGDTALVSGRAITHTLGHCFNLYHPFSNTGCIDEDSVSDTPIEYLEAFGCPTFPLTDICTVSSAGVMYMNFMNYAAESCTNMFTQGQATRMQNSLNFYFPLLINSVACLPVGIDENISNNSIICRPNPFSNSILVSVENDKINSINLFSSIGKIISISKEFSIEKNEIKLNTNFLAQGIYFLQVISEKVSVIKTIIKY